ncbi:MAG TPA: SDR family oxidoreductase [Candidatus Ruania gallistercoris]|uniref:SDR family oxidoreductase n=1 Tax=Candidatus Ruania gallistercoris TaxID=2838746 RepID=A0A9D2EEB0_9MICO|nr:SDR family oxidoreductase [Candidatus Ruania gallistercoris]
MSARAERVVVITGATGGIGAATARAVHAAGAIPVLVHYRDAERAEALATELGDAVFTADVDVRESDQVAVTVEAVTDRYGRIDVLVNNAGLMDEIAFTEMTEADWERTIGTDLTGVFQVTRHVLPVMLEAGSGVVVSVASQLALKGAAGYTAYCAAKAGVIGLTRALAREVGPAIRVCAIAPGPVRTPMTAPYLTEEWVAERAGSLVSGRLAEPAEIAAAIWYLAGDGAALMHGQTLHANGGGVLA